MPDAERGGRVDKRANYLAGCCGCCQHQGPQKPTGAQQTPPSCRFDRCLWRRKAPINAAHSCASPIPTDLRREVSPQRMQAPKMGTSRYGEAFCAAPSTLASPACHAVASHAANHAPSGLGTPLRTLNAPQVVLEAI